MKGPTLVTFLVLTTASAAFAQSTTPVNPNTNPNNCSPAFTNCSSATDDSNKTPGNTPGTSRNEMRQEEQIPQTATEPDLPMKSPNCAPGQTNCPPEQSMPPSRSAAPGTTQ